MTALFFVFIMASKIVFETLIVFFLARSFKAISAESEMHLRVDPGPLFAEAYSVSCNPIRLILFFLPKASTAVSESDGNPSRKSQPLYADSPLIPSSDIELNLMSDIPLPLYLAKA